MSGARAVPVKWEMVTRRQQVLRDAEARVAQIAGDNALQRRTWDTGVAASTAPELVPGPAPKVPRLHDEQSQEPQVPPAPQAPQGEEPVVRRGRGRPRKLVQPQAEPQPPPVKRGRGRPRKYPLVQPRVPVPGEPPVVRRKRGRPLKVFPPVVIERPVDANVEQEELESDEEDMTTPIGQMPSQKRRRKLPAIGEGPMPTPEIVIGRIYATQWHPAAFSSKRRLYKAARDRMRAEVNVRVKADPDIIDEADHPDYIGDNVPEVTHEDIDRYLRAQDAYTLHAPARKRYPHNRVMSYNVNGIWDIDLAEFGEYARHNNGYKYMLVVVDILSKRAWLRPLKTKTTFVVTQAMRSIIDEARAADTRPPGSRSIPHRIRSDRGGEFISAMFLALMTEKGIHHYLTSGIQKASIAERFIRTLKMRINRYQTHYNTHRYIDVLQDILDAYMHAKHSSIGMAPKDATYDKTNELFFTLYPPPKNSAQLASIAHMAKKIDVGDSVRVSRYKGLFEKEGDDNWSREIYTVKSVIEVGYANKLPMFHLITWNNKLVIGGFYPHEVLKVAPKGADAVYNVEDELGTKMVKGIEWTLIKWLGYKMPTWELSSNIGNL